MYQTQIRYCNCSRFFSSSLLSHFNYLNLTTYMDGIHNIGIYHYYMEYEGRAPLGIHDVQTCVFFNPKIPEDAAYATFKLTGCVEELRDWLNDSTFKLYNSQTEIVITSSLHNMDKLADNKFQISEVIITPSSIIKSLGIHLMLKCAILSKKIWYHSTTTRKPDEESIYVLEKCDFSYSYFI